MTPQLTPSFIAKALARNKIRTTPQLIEIEEPAEIGVVTRNKYKLF